MAVGKTLVPIHARIDVETIDNTEWLVDPELMDGGAAMMAYAMMQFTQMSDDEARLAAKALLRYCELDTFAMVMIYEHWREAVRAPLSPEVDLS